MVVANKDVFSVVIVAKSPVSVAGALWAAQG